MGKLLTTNTKLKKDGIFGWSLTAGASCPMSGGPTCAKCFMKRLYCIRPNVKTAHDNNFALSLTDEFVPRMVAEIKKNKSLRVVRIHVSGDFYDQAYVNKWADIARACPDVQFYAYTTSLHLDYSGMPANFAYAQSRGANADHLAKDSVSSCRAVRGIKKTQFDDSDLESCRAMFAKRDIVLKLR